MCCLEGQQPELWLSGHHYSVLKERPPGRFFLGPPAQRDSTTTVTLLRFLTHSSLRTA
jgi:hypothetical protein